MMKLKSPYLHKQRAHKVIYHIQTNESIQLSEQSVHDIHTNFYHAVIEECSRAREREEYWTNEYNSLMKKGFPKKWNELRIKMARMKEITPDEVLALMFKLDEDESIR